MRRTKKRKYPDLPERSHPDYLKLYQEKNKDILKVKAKKRYLKRVADNPNIFKEQYDAEKASEYRRKNRAILMERQWIKRGIINFTYDNFLDELKNQENRCKICKKEMDSPQVDHCHTTGKYRGILCIPCNNGLGVYELNKHKYEKYLKDT